VGVQVPLPFWQVQQALAHVLAQVHQATRL
jgi:hypothetical protein